MERKIRDEDIPIKTTKNNSAMAGGKYGTSGGRSGKSKQGGTRTVAFDPNYDPQKETMKTSKGKRTWTEVEDETKGMREMYRGVMNHEKIRTPSVGNSPANSRVNSPLQNRSRGASAASDGSASVDGSSASTAEPAQALGRIDMLAATGNE
jgi:hypothetical protein